MKTDTDLEISLLIFLAKDTIRIHKANIIRLETGEPSWIDGNPMTTEERAESLKLSKNAISVWEETLKEI